VGVIYSPGTGSCRHCTAPRIWPSSCESNRPSRQLSLASLSSRNSMSSNGLRLGGHLGGHVGSESSEKTESHLCLKGKFSYSNMMFPPAWARGAVGSASEWHSEGQGFESPRVHQSYRVPEALQSSPFPSIFNCGECGFEDDIQPSVAPESRDTAEHRYGRHESRSWRQADPNVLQLSHIRLVRFRPVRGH
jgi:hypothetical protein